MILKNRMDKFVEVVSDLNISEYNQKQYREIIQDIASEFFEPEVTEDLIHVIDVKEQTIKAMDNFDLSDFINSKVMIKEKRYLLTPDADSAMHILTKFGEHHERV